MSVQSAPSVRSDTPIGSLEWCRAWAQLMRVGTIVAGVSVCVVGARLSDEPIVRARLVAAATCVALLIAFAQVVNDIVDVDVDRLQGRLRPLVRGAINRDHAIAFAFGAGAAGLLASSLLGAWALATAGLILAASWMYSLRLKDTVVIGNLVVATLASAPVPFGAVANGGLTPRAWRAQLLLLVFMLGFEVLKTGRDVDGDRAVGLRTIATVHGLRATCGIAGALCLLFAVVSLQATSFARHPVGYLTTILIAAGAVTWSGVRLLRSARRPDANVDIDVPPPLRALRAAWLPGVLALLFL